MIHISALKKYIFYINLYIIDKYKLQVISNIDILIIELDAHENIKQVGKWVMIWIL